MSSGLFKYIIYFIYMYKWILASNYQQRLICRKTQTNQEICLFIQIKNLTSTLISVTFITNILCLIDSFIDFNGILTLLGLFHA